MTTAGVSSEGSKQRRATTDPWGQVSVEHYLRVILHRKWLVLGVFLLVSAVTFLVSYGLPNVYTSETLILVDPQKVPESYVKSTVTGDVRNRLGTLSQQILSATRLQKIIETLNLYPEARKTQPREEVISRMRADISVHVVSDFGGSQDLQAFRITYSGKEPRVVAQVTNELASLFIEENLKAREQQATGTSEFLQNQLLETRKALEAQEAKLKDFKLKHVGEMPEQETADLQILGQLQSQLQLEGDALARTQQQKSYIQSMMAQSAPVVDLDNTDTRSLGETGGKTSNTPKASNVPKSTLASDKARLTALLSHYTEKHPEVRKLKKQIEDEEAKEAREAKETKVNAVVAEATPPPPSSEPPKRAAMPPMPVNYVNPVLQAQLKEIDAEFAKHKEEQQRLAKLVAKYQAKLEVIPVREQEVAVLVRDYEMSKAHYSQLLDKQLSAETATQLEIRQKGEKFSILDPGQVPEKPTRPNRTLINVAGSLVGLALGFVLALMTEFLGMSITGPEQITAATGFPVLEVIPVIRTQIDRLIWRRRMLWATASGVAIALIGGVVLLYHYRSQLF
jgi:polysaccharide biosynthesis transport protein